LLSRDKHRVREIGDDTCGSAATRVRVFDDRGAPDALVERVARLPARQRYRSAHEIMLALGINAPEEQAGNR